MVSSYQKDKAEANRGGLQKPEALLREANTGETKARKRGRGTACVPYHLLVFTTANYPLGLALPELLRSHHSGIASRCTGDL
uniref:Uncharacterized protein n=1 Tax=Arundo donax TaxID=35708 RepID=A0A0A9GYC1_ARUDO